MLGRKRWPLSPARSRHEPRWPDRTRSNEGSRAARHLLLASAASRQLCSPKCHRHTGSRQRGAWGKGSDLREAPAEHRELLLTYQADPVENFSRFGMQGPSAVDQGKGSVQGKPKPLTGRLSTWDVYWPQLGFRSGHTTAAEDRFARRRRWRQDAFATHAQPQPARLSV